MKASVDENKCIACGTCEGLCPECFKVEGVAKVIKEDGCADCECDLKDVASSCPAGAISVEE